MKTLVLDPKLQEEDNKTALHKAAWNCDHVLMEMLLEAGADTRAMDINGCAPIQYLLKATDIRPMAITELCYQLLLNYNAARIYPPQFHKVTKCLEMFLLFLGKIYFTFLSSFKGSKYVIYFTTKCIYFKKRLD